MAFTLTIKSKGLFNKAKSIDLEAILKNCGLRYGSDNEFYILIDGEVNNNTVILYNPNRIGRGIFFDYGNVGKGEVTLSYNIPTTAAEIKDFIKVTKEIERQFGKASFYCEEEKRDFTTSSLEENFDRMVEFSRIKLNEFCSNEEMKKFILTMAMFPWYMDEDKREKYKTCTSLDDLENTIHNLQSADLYYAKPTLFRNNNDGKIMAAYTMTTNCDSSFPVNPESFLNMGNIKIDESIIRFFVYEENKPLDGFYPYSKFVEFIKQKGATKFDAERLQIRGLSKEEIMEFVNSMRN